VSEIENIANLELTKICKWARENKVRFNEKKSKTMLMSRRKRKEKGEVEVYLNKKLLRQVKTMKYLGIIIDKKLTFREHKTGDRQMQEINICFINISKTKLGFKP
jgi:hypothetical protein